MKKILITLFLFVIFFNGVYKVKAFIPDEVKKAVAFIYTFEEKKKLTKGATGFFIGEQNSQNPEQYFVCLVTAKHVIQTDDLKSFLPNISVRLNTLDGKSDTIGQSWTTLVYMPFIAYVDKATRAQLLGVRGGTNDFWDQVGPHEVAHQWWGHIVGWTSYRDQWMSEGFSEFSASLYTQFVDKDIDQFIDYWNKQRELIVTPRAATKGMKPYKVGPLVQGFKLVSSKTGNVYRYLIYPKGAFVLHMLRMMMYDYKEGTGDARFKAMMKDFIKTNFNKPVSTQDFQAAAERNITPEMDIDKNKTMNWFFDEWVYGTDVPSYKFEYHLQGNTLTGTITQSNVSKNFVMIVPIYADFGTGWQYLASVTLAGNDTLDIGKINLPKAPKKVAIAALQDILTEKIENVSK